MKRFVLERNDSFLNRYPVKRISNGIISCRKNREFSYETATVLYGQGVEYYLIGKLDPEMEAQLEHAQRLFRNKFFKSLLKDRFSFSEWVVIAIGSCTIFLNLMLYMKLMEFFKFVNI